MEKIYFIDNFIQNLTAKILNPFLTVFIFKLKINNFKKKFFN